MRLLTLVSAAAAVLAPVLAVAQSPAQAAAPAPGADAAGVERACMDYIDSIYQMKPDLLDGCTSPALVKVGFVFDEKARAYTMSPMTFATLRELAATHNKDGAIPKGAPREVWVLGVMDQVAEAKIAAVWGIDYIQLAKVDGKWQIQHIVWQTPPKDPSADDADLVKRACLDYAESAYLVKPENVDLSVHPDLVKVGYIRRGEDEEYRRSPMTHQQLKDLVAKWNANGQFGPGARKDVEVLDVSDQTACAKLAAEWGVDYFHLAKFDGKWQIVQVIWQTYPPEEQAGQ